VGGGVEGKKSLMLTSAPAGRIEESTFIESGESKGWYGEQREGVGGRGDGFGGNADEGLVVGEGVNGENADEGVVGGGGGVGVSADEGMMEGGGGIGWDADEGMAEGEGGGRAEREGGFGLGIGDLGRLTVGLETRLKPFGRLDAAATVTSSRPAKREVVEGKQPSCASVHSVSSVKRQTDTNGRVVWHTLHKCKKPDESAAK
jgi:hypothetical protein